MRRKMKRYSDGARRSRWLLLVAVAVSLLLSGCGKKASPPDSYTINEDTLPSLSASVTLDETMQFSEEKGEDGETSYVYGELASGGETAKEYAKALEEGSSCKLLTADAAGYADDSAFSEESGEVLVATESQSGTGLFQLDLQWDATSCTVTPAYAEDGKMPEDTSAMTLDEAVEYLQSMSPAALGLSGKDMSGYQIFPEDGLAMLDGQPCISMNVYSLATHQYEGTYLIAGESNQVYRLDRSTGEAVSIAAQ